MLFKLKKLIFSLFSAIIKVLLKYPKNTIILNIIINKYIESIYIDKNYNE